MSSTGGPRGRHMPRLAPQHAMILVALLSAAMVLLAVRAAAETRWLGLELSPSGEGLRVVTVNPGGPAEGHLTPGDVVVALRGDDGARVAVGPLSLQVDPDILPTYAQYNRFFAAQGELHDRLGNSAITLVLSHGGEVTLRPTDHRPLGQLPVEFWILLLFAVLVLQVGAGIWAFRPERVANRLIVMTAAAYALSTGTMAIYTTREWAMDPGLFRWLSELNHGGNLFFAFSSLALVTVYPRPVTRWPAVTLSLGLALALWCNELGQWFEWPLHAFHLPYFVPYAAGSAVSWAQWRATRGRPDERAALKWFLLSVFMTIGVVMLLYFLPELLGEEPLIAPWVGQLLLCGLYGGLVLGVQRFRLFELERWWFAAWLWFLGGVLVVVADLSLMYVANMQPMGALGLALILVGWVYFPARQWLWRRLVRSPSLQVEAHLPLLLEAFFSAPAQASNEQWLGVLRRIFDPLDARLSEGRLAGAAIERNGLVLAVPDIDGESRVILTGGGRGERLFSRDDVALASMILALARKSAGLRAAQERGATLERERIARDLHDDVAPQLLTLIHGAANPLTAERAREAMQTLRESIYALNAPPDEPLENVLAIWRCELSDRAEAAGIALSWHQEGRLEGASLASRQRLNLARVLREAVSNALRHALPTRLRIEIVGDGDSLMVALQHDGRISPTETWRAGNGVANMRTRIGELGGTIEWHPVVEGCAAPELQVMWRVPLQASFSARVAARVCFDSTRS